jgi:hypothetical protein
VAGSPFRSKTWCVLLAVVFKRCGGDLQRVRRLGIDRFSAGSGVSFPTGPRCGYLCAVALLVILRGGCRGR